ncbi:MAG: hypothetical protein JSV62_00190 [Promethearchaeota archaeon]|nr:MAG: hypothetical protein JSV62_00190 [Candidatus Lokiarchaeota archaeon]
MSQENIDEKDSTLIEYEKLVEELMHENESLKKRVTELEEENRILKGSEEIIHEEPIREIQYETKKPILDRDIVERDIVERDIVITTTLSQDTVPLEMGKGPIVDGYSRRECPICGNTNKAFIQEIIDRSHIISAYPRMYGKKYKCGQCGREWRIPLEM